MTTTPPRNPGPSWGFGFLRWVNRNMPVFIRNGIIIIASSLAWAFMRKERIASKEYLSIIGGKPCTNFDNFKAFGTMLMAKLRAGDGRPVSFEWASPADSENGALLFSKQQLLLGTFHVGGSEFLGFHSANQTRKVAMIRERRQNSGDIDRLVEHSNDNLRIIWVDSGNSVIFALRDLIEEGYSIALQCDRAEHASKTAVFDFLGDKRRMPITIYRLAQLYGLPVSFFIALPGETDLHFQVKAYPPFKPTATGKKEQIRAAEEHFQGVLRWLEQILAEHPEQWFNFLPLNQLAPFAEEKT